MSQIQNKTILITGGASGIGRQTAAFLARAGAHRIILWDCDSELLSEVVQNLKAQGYPVEGTALDITQRSRIHEELERLKRSGALIEILINNAGVIAGHEFAQHTADDIDRTIAVNTLAPMHLTLEVLKEMLPRHSGHIVNIASAASMIANPGMAVYCGSKWGIFGWSESLRIEMERGQTGIHVTTVAPYYIDTGMFSGVRSRFIPILKTDAVAKAIVRAIERNQTLLCLPWIIYLLPLIKGILPRRWFDWLIGEGLGVYHTMDHFQGRLPQRK